ncbi:MULTISPECIES: class I tRNA ligase family protein [Streptomyces]|uniref:Cupin domain-containing protein n=3 Tax=Streptomyces TaxID=1883 RepID=A0AA37FC07_9ACTN|nr:MULTISPECIES: class I tRNA ligase family protein [Streptomyces]QLA57445.1 class I tRNA ligase family protein [Streptomyces violascens]AWL33777.1 cupin domain-containing protein [Streptomyces sp. SM17]MBT2876751.1 class I tRNA ligase family protein [Streptomyces sp. McG6]MBT2883594.1 class I tRNA ligase family protein [Streptomyces sp. McG5]MBT2889507.1 class I tRNA ligase family protein [Streptomyces sp. McG2]
MITRAFDRSAMSWSYEMHLQPMLSATDIEGLPFGSVFGSVPAHTVSKRHAHQDGEMFIVLAGKAVVVLGEEERVLGPGEVVHLSPFGFHEIRNDFDEPFDIVSVFWEHIPSAVAVLEKSPPRDQLAERSLVFCPPPTPNGGLHLGHLAGPYVRADMLARALRSMGREARYVTGTDDHQSYVAAAARLRGTTPAEVATAEGDAIVATLRSAGVTLDRLTRPAADPGHGARIRELLEKVAASPAAKEEERPTAYCPTCALSLHQAFARGRCAHCDAASDGEICEACGRPNEARELSAAHCRICGTEAVTRTERALWLDLDAYAAELREYLRLAHTPPDLLTLVERLLDEGLPAYRLGRTTEWGVDLGDGQALDAWADLALTFLDAARTESEQNGPARIALFLGYDNSFYYAVLLPVLAFAAGLADHLPAAFVTNQFLHLGDEKFSTSRGHAVWADDALAAAGPDAVRLALLREAPEGRVTRITAERAGQLTEDPLYRAAHAWLDGFAASAGEDGAVVPGTGAWTDVHREFYRYLNLATRQLDGLLLPESFSARSYVDQLESFVTRCAEFRAAEQALRATPSLAEEARTSLALEYLAAKVFAALAWPITPGLAQRVWEWLGLPGEPVREADWTFLPSGTRCAAPAPAPAAASGHA